MVKNEQKSTSAFNYTTLDADYSIKIAAHVLCLKTTTHKKYSSLIFASWGSLSQK